MATTFSPTDKDAGITVSNTNHTVTGNSGNNVARASAYKTSGKLYIEFPANSLSAAICRVGIAPSTVPLNDNAWTGGWGVDGAGNLITPGGGSGFAIGNITGQTVQMAIDFGAGLFWARLNGGNWNGNATRDPATGVGGVGTGATIAVGLGPSAMIQNIGSHTVNCGDTSFSYSIPSGFSAFDATGLPNTKRSFAAQVC